MTGVVAVLPRDHCPECGSEARQENGEVVCSGCGLVLCDVIANEAKYYPQVTTNHHYPRRRVQVVFTIPSDEMKDRVRHVVGIAMWQGVKMSEEKLRAIAEYLVKKHELGQFPQKPLGIKWRDIRKVERVVLPYMRRLRRSDEDYLRWCMQRLDIHELKLENGYTAYEVAATVMRQISNRQLRTRCALAIYYVCIKYGIDLSKEQIAHACSVCTSTINANLHLLSYVRE